MSLRSPRVWFMLLGAVMALTSCSDDDNPAAPEPRGSIRVQMKHVVGDEDLKFSNLIYTNASGNTFSVTKLQYYMTDVELRGPDGNVALDQVHYVDASLSETMDFQRDDIPAGHYQALAFTFGLDEQKNQDGALPNTPENVNMQWPDDWGGGYHYMKLEGKYLDSQGQEDGFATHTGRFKADNPDSVAHHHYIEVVLELNQDVVEDETLDVEVVMDINEWYTNPNDIDLISHSNGIMMDTPKQNLLEQNAATVFDMNVVGK